MKEKISDIDKGYIAGFIDGEGSIKIGKHKQKDRFILNPRIEVYNSNQEVIQYIQSKIGGNIGCFHKRNPHYNESYRLLINGREDIIKVLMFIKDYLKVKKERAEILLEYCRLRDDKIRLCRLVHQKDRLEISHYDCREWSLFEKMKKLNKRGDE